MQAKIITSIDNAKVKQLKKLQLKKYRKDMHMFVVENLAIIHDALKDGHKFEDLYMTEEFVESHIQVLDQISKKAGIKSYFQMIDKINRAFSKLDSPSGIAATYRMRDMELPLDETCIYLNGINDPGNLGTIFRSALAFNIKNIIVDSKTVDIYNAKVINAAKDSFFKLNIIEDTEGDWLKNTGLPIYTTSSHKGESLKEFKSAEKYCLVLGSEAHGVSDEIMKLATEKIKIDISKDIESLNVASAASILFYELNK
ncbi:RNA methyltransferase [Patescibacteria group bacterium]|nr:RNA methyltransferase [Patescibacteria group bacterium]